ncbi:hypothetical protein GCM10011348_03610 [Marinobacterium nitratireducens]|uniref:Uncharacterized protein n=1 Tax=Marinobacterium nitratireducens TaxID=518897 RepID=A0A918DPH7_9GAMM|nr:hypothetical protein [Marinobacterium nitratireducens]GGO76427.1 hypothetical protein GCM10011348_03610 [Marinobacterium nitratireducens]
MSTRKCEEYFQIAIGWARGKASALGKAIGPSVRAEEVPDVIERSMAIYLHYREVEEAFIDTLGRICLAPFKEGAYDRGWSLGRQEHERPDQDRRW